VCVWKCTLVSVSAVRLLDGAVVRLGRWHLTCRGGLSLRALGPTQAPAVAAALLAVSELLAAEAVDDDASALRRLHADATARKAAPGLRQGAEADHKSTV
jgi:hypothetical protein